jgi:hypothetical protein
VSRPALRLAEPTPVTSEVPGGRVSVAVAGRVPIDRLVRLAVDRRVVVLVPGARRVAGVDVLHAAARSPKSDLEIVHLTAVGIGARYLEAVGGRAAASGWAPHEICCLVSEVERRMTSWVCGPRLPLGRARPELLPRRSAAVLGGGRWRVAASVSGIPDEMLERGLARGSSCLAALSGPGGRWADELLDGWRQAGAVAGRLDGGLARELGIRWTLDLAVAPTLTASGLSTLREQVASAPRCGWCRLPVLGTACPRCAVEDAR